MDDDRLNPRLIKHVLDRSLEKIDQPVLDRLRVARMRALNCRDMESAGVASLSWDGRHLIRHASASWHRLGYWAGALLLTAMVFIGIAYWQQSADSDNDDEEIAILTDDLPIQYFLE